MLSKINVKVISVHAENCRKFKKLNSVTNLVIEVKNLGVSLRYLTPLRFPFSNGIRHKKPAPKVDIRSLLVS